MHNPPDALLTSATLFHRRYGGFPLFLCTYALLDEHSNETAGFDRIVVIWVTALNGERFRLRDCDKIQRFPAAVGRLPAEVAP